VKFQILRRPIGESASANEFYDEFDCSPEEAEVLVTGLRRASPEWWYTSHETKLSPIERRARYW